MVDGDLSDACWSGAEASPRFVPLGGDTGSDTPSRMRIRFLHDAERLYVSVAADSRPGEVPVARSQRAHDGKVFYDDSVELFLYPRPVSQEYLHVILNCDSAAYDAKATTAGGAGAGRAWEPVWEHQTRKQAGRWSAEMAFPFASLDIPAPRRGFAWRVRVGHNSPGVPHEMWPRNPSTSFHNPACGAYLVFGGSNLLPNGGFEGPAPKGVPAGWHFGYHESEGKGIIQLWARDAPEGNRMVRYEKTTAPMWFPQLWTAPVPIQPHSEWLTESGGGGAVWA